MIGAVDIGGTKIAIGLVENSGRLVESAQFATDSKSGFSEIFGRISESLGLLTKKHSAPLSAIGIGCTGRVDANGVFLDNKFLPSLSGQNLALDLSTAFSVPCSIENDADAAALGEYLWGSGHGSRRMIFITISTGIGGGIIFDGALYRGVDGSHPEIGHHVIQPDGPACFCGASGCWERMASGTAMAEWGLQAGGPRYHNARTICALADEGDELALQMVAREGYYLGLGLANLITIFAPDCIVLGGGVMSRWDLFSSSVKEILNTHCKLVPAHKTNLVLASLGPQTGLLGAAAVAVAPR